MRILKLFIFIFILLNVPLVHALNFNCPNSYCGINLSYPFKLYYQQPQVCSHYIDLTCTSQNKTILNLPFSGDFHVVSVLYYARSITLRDPHNCLAERLMNLNLSSSPFAAEYYQSFTFYNCLSGNQVYRYDFKVIDCLSIAPNVTVATYVLSEEMMKSYGCTKIVTREIPVGWSEGDYDIFSNFKLKWNVPSCRDCEAFDYQKEEESKKKRNPRLISILILIPLVIVVAFLVASYKRVMNQRRHANARAATRTTTREAAQPRQTITTAAAMQPQLVSVEDMMIVPDGQYSYLKTMVFSTFLEGNLGSLESHDQGNCCSICLEEYSSQDIIRCFNSCHHYFHSQCIDQWLQDNSSCPICRNSIFNV